MTKPTINVFSAPCGAGKTQHAIIPTVVKHARGGVTIVTANTKLLQNQTTEDIKVELKRDSLTRLVKVIKINEDEITGEQIGKVIVSKTSEALNNPNNLGLVLVVTLSGFTHAFTKNEHLLNHHKLRAVHVDEIDELIKVADEHLLLGQLDAIATRSKLTINGVQHKDKAGLELLSGYTAKPENTTFTFDVEGFTPLKGDKYISSDKLQALLLQEKSKWAVIGTGSVNNTGSVDQLRVVSYAYTDLLKLLSNPKVTVYTAAPQYTDLELCKQLGKIDYVDVSGGSVTFDAKQRKVIHYYVCPESTGGKTLFSNPDNVKSVITAVEEIKPGSKVLLLANCASGEKSPDKKDSKLSTNRTTVLRGKVRGINDYRDYDTVVTLQRFEPDNAVISALVALADAPAGFDALYRDVKTLQESYQGIKRANLRNQYTTAECVVVHLNKELAEKTITLLANEQFDNSTPIQLPTKSTAINSVKPSGRPLGNEATKEARDKCSEWMKISKRIVSIKALAADPDKYWDAILKDVLRRNTKLSKPFDVTLITEIVNDRQPKKGL